MEIFKYSVSFSQTLRRQRPYWSVTLPDVVLNEKEVGTIEVHSASYDPASMLNVNCDDDNMRGEQPAKSLVKFFITPILSKRGKVSGEKFDVDQVLRKAVVETAGCLHEEPARNSQMMRG